MDVPLHVLRYFCVLAEELHFGNAAKELNISAPSLSQQISRLERTMDVQLFERNPRQVTLTAAGSELLPLARRVRDDHEDILRWARGRQHGRGDTILRVGIVAAGAGTLTTSILTNAVQRMPAVRFEMRRLGFFDINSELIAGRVDVVFCPSPVDSDARVRTQPLWNDPRVLVVPPNHRLAGRTSIGILETSDEVFVSASGGNPAIVDWWLVDPRPDGSHAKRGPVADDAEGLLELVAVGTGVSIAVVSAATHFGRLGLEFIPIHDIEPATVLLCSLVRPANPAVRVLESIAAEFAGTETG